MNLEQRTQALLALVQQFRLARCAQAIEPARAQADALLRDARHEARRRVHTAVAEERQRLMRDLTAAQARLATERRAFAQRRAVRLLDAGWTALRAALLARWGDAAMRQRWIRSHLERALSALPRDATTRWQIVVPPDLSAAERESLLAWLAQRGISHAACDEDRTITAGVRMTAGANAMDATLEGLLADRAALEGHLLQAVPADAVEHT